MCKVDENENKKSKKRDEKEGKRENDAQRDSV